jgi:hypothetical protein
MSANILTLMGVSDISLHMNDSAESWFASVASTLNSSGMVN